MPTRQKFNAAYRAIRIAAKGETTLGINPMCKWFDGCINEDGDLFSWHEVEDIGVGHKPFKAFVFCDFFNLRLPHMPMLWAAKQSLAARKWASERPATPIIERYVSEWDDANAYEYN